MHIAHHQACSSLGSAGSFLGLLLGLHLSHSGGKVVQVVLCLIQKPGNGLVSLPWGGAAAMLLLQQLLVGLKVVRLRGRRVQALAALMAG